MLTLTKFAGPSWKNEDMYRGGPAAFAEAALDKESPQHPMRAWEYATAVSALEMWRGLRPHPLHALHRLALDVGGAGSPLKHLLKVRFAEVLVVDPAAGGPAIEALEPEVLADALFSISVLEHVEDPYSFLEACVRHLRPGGLLFLTVDAWDPPVLGAPDTAHFHWMRKRIFDKEGISHVMDTLRQLGCQPFGGIDLEYKGATVYDYTFASICMKKEGA